MHRPMVSQLFYIRVTTTVLLPIAAQKVCLLFNYGCSGTNHIPFVVAIQVCCHRVLP